MDVHPRLRAYGWDIAGSLFGTVAFAIASALGAPHWIWPGVVALMWLLIERRSLAAYATWVPLSARKFFGSFASRAPGVLDV